MLFFALNNFDAIMDFFSWLGSVFSPFIYGAIMAFLLHMPMVFFEERLFFKFRKRRALAIVLTYICAIVAIFFLFRLVVPQIIESIRSLLGNTSNYLENLNELMDYFGRQFGLEPEGVDEFRLSYEDVIYQLLTLTREFLPDILNLSMRIGTGVVRVLTAFIASVYMLASKDKLQRQCRRLLYAFAPKKAADESVRILRLSTRIFSGFIGGKILESIIIGIVCFVGMTLMNALFIEMPFIPLITVIIAITNVIPFFGPFIGAIPSAMILLMINPMSALWFTIFIIIVQQLDGNILGPRILGDSTGLPPLWVLFAIVVGGGMFGFAGMIAGVPVVAVLHTLVHELINGRLLNKGFNSDAHIVIVSEDTTAAEDGGDAGINTRYIDSDNEDISENSDNSASSDDIV